MKTVLLTFLAMFFFGVSAAAADGAPPAPWHREPLFAGLERPRAVAETLSLSVATRGLLESLLSDEQWAKTQAVLTAPDAWGSLGPHAPAGPAAPRLPRPESVVRLEIPADAAGSGTAADPYVDVIGAFLSRYAFAPHAIEGYRSYPDPAALDDYLAGLDYQPQTVLVPAGWYRETATALESPLTRVSRRNTCLEVPPGIRLEAAGPVVLQPAVAEGESAVLVHLNIGSGLVGFTLDGSVVPGFEPRPATRVTAVEASHRAFVAGNHIHDFTHRGIDAAGNRGRAGAFVSVHDNIIERIGMSGISSQSRWLIQDNQIRHAGILRPTGGGGDDGIIPRWGVAGLILNNLVILERRPHARHVISGQAAHDHLIAGNISIAVGPTRNNIGLSDGSHRNRLIGNLALTTGDATSTASQAGISVNGYGTIIQHNVSLGSIRAFRPLGREGRPLPLVSDNYAEYSKPRHWSSAADFHRAGGHFEARDNEIRAQAAPLPDPEPEKFGFFAPRPPPAAE